MRSITRFLVFLFVGIVGPADGKIRSFFLGSRYTPAKKYEWAKLWSRILCWNFGVRIITHGKRVHPDAQVIISNHLGYLDILCFIQLGTMNFVSKADVKDWPLVGGLTSNAGTLYLKREKKSDIPRVLRSFQKIVDSGSRVIFFPEGTSSGGESVLPFHSSLFQVPAQNEWKIQTAAIKYKLPNNSALDPSEKVCYWGDMEFVPHFKELLKLPQIDCHIFFKEDLYSGSDRKDLALKLHKEVQSNLNELKSL